MQVGTSSPNGPAGKQWRDRTKHWPGADPSVGGHHPIETFATLYAAMVATMKLREILFLILFFPICIPVIIDALNALQKVMGGQELRQSGWYRWFCQRSSGVHIHPVVEVNAPHYLNSDRNEHCPTHAGHSACLFGSLYALYFYLLFLRVNLGLAEDAIEEIRARVQ